MKTILRYLCLGLTVLAGLSSWPAAAGFPRPSFTLYGQARDPYGWPYMTNATVNLLVNGKVYKTCAIAGSISPGVNFLFRLPLDEGAGLPYDNLAARSGDTLQITIVAGGQTWNINKLFSLITVEELLGLANQLSPPGNLVPGNLPLVGQPGGIVGLNVTAGTDDNNNGIPDAWEQWIVDNSWDSRIQSIYDVQGQDDFDGDGVSNFNEYLAGTDPAWNKDYIRIEELERTANGRLGLKFLTIPGKSYRIVSASLAGSLARQWQSCAYAKSPTGDLQSGFFEGTGFYLSLYVEMSQTTNVISQTTNIFGLPGNTFGQPTNMISQTTNLFRVEVK
jgi:hypothetical protein